MSVLDVAKRPAAEAPACHGLPDPGEPVPRLALPTVATCFAAAGRADLYAGYLLTGRSHPTSPAVTVDCDA